MGNVGIAFAGVTGDERPGVALTVLGLLDARRIKVFLPKRRASTTRAAGNGRGDLAVATIATRPGKTQGHPMAPYLVPTFAWTHRDDRLAVYTSSGGDVQVRSRPDVHACLSDLAVDRDGGATVVWWQGAAADLDFSVQAAHAAPGTRFGPAEPIATNARPGGVFAAADPRTGRVTAVWASGDGELMSARRDP